MERRQYLLILANTTFVAISGCSMSDNNSQNTENDSDKDSDNDTNGGNSGPSTHNTHPTEQGAADPVTVTVTVDDAETGIDDTRCRNEARDTISTLLLDNHEFDDLLIKADDQVVMITIHTAVYDRTGEKIREVDYEFDDVKNVTPSNLSIETEDGDVVCEYPVYVAAKEIQYD